MAKPMPRSFQSPLVLAIGFLLLLGLGAGVAWLLANRGGRGPLQVVLVCPPGDRDPELGVPLGRAIGALVQDHLEHCGHMAITSLTELPRDLAPFGANPRTLLVELRPRREGPRLALAYRFLWGREAGGPEPLGWQVREVPALPPQESFRAFLASFPQPVEAPCEVLVPTAAPLTWDLLQASALRLQNQQLEHALALAHEVTRQEPACASGWFLLGNLRYRWMLNKPEATRLEQAEAEACLEKGLALAPDHPRGTFLLSLLKSDSGNQREALDMLLVARRRQPANPTLLTGIAYAARGAGLLPLARRAMDLRDRLAFARLQPQAVDITCLYTGELDRFAASLQEQPGHLRSTAGVLPFYRGYLALVQGNRDLALREFRSVAGRADAYPSITRLSQVFALILEGQRDEAWKALRAYDQERMGMREPDGEFTLRLAEAYALLGDRASAMDMVGRAFARGFGCTAWYERSPMLEPLRSLPKWQSLMQHLQERQALLEERFPVGLLEPL